MEIIKIDSFEKLLIIAPHPDDESIGCGGLLLQYSTQCDVICMTDGRQGQGDVSPQMLANIRNGEFASAMSFANPHEYKMLDVADGTLCAHLDALEGVDFSIYTKVFVTGPEDRHPDHTAVLTALKRACIKQKAENEIYVYEVHRKLGNVTHILPIGEVLEKKKELIRFYSSQIKNYPFDELIIGINRERGMGKGYCEGFCKVELSEIPDVIPLDTEIAKMREYYWVYTRWMRSLQSGNSIAGILMRRGNISVMIYGFKELGRLLLKELITAGFDVPMIIDKRKITSGEGISIVCPEDIPDNMKDIPIVVTATWYMDDIRTELAERGFTEIFSIKELLEEHE